ncbi:hypothetical protein J6590_053939 [Homalodisca vitripennis]|nr:hypothetical protein J6590_053939 [Homalodisca vitripennis]
MTEALEVITTEWFLVTAVMRGELIMWARGRDTIEFQGDYTLDARFRKGSIEVKEGKPRLQVCSE